MEKYRNRVHKLMLYPDNPEHVEAMQKIAEGYDYAAILHNKDTWTAEDEKKDPTHKEGTLKKDHWHVVLRFKQAVWNTALCKELGIDERFCEKVKGFDAVLQYLIHYNDSNKAQYSLDEVFGNLKTKLVESINKVEKSEGEKVAELIEWITSLEEPVRITDFAVYCAKNGYWAEFRRSGAIFCKIIEEHNIRVTQG